MRQIARWSAFSKEERIILSIALAKLALAHNGVPSALYARLEEMQNQLRQDLTVSDMAKHGALPSLQNGAAK